MSAKLQGLRLTSELRALVDDAGERLNPAARALLIIGAATAGQPVGHLQSTIHVLIGAGGLAPETVAALQRLLSSDSNTAITGAITPHEPRPLTGLSADPFTGVGFEV